MILFELPNNWLGCMITDVAELPTSDAKRVYIDFETATTGVPKDDIFHTQPRGCKRRGGVFPYLGDTICGICITWEECEWSYYVPIRHTDSRYNLPVDRVSDWLRRVLEAADEWVNHNIKFDAHFALQDFGIDFTGRMVDTLTLAKCLYTDRPSHGLKDLCRDWCELDMRGEGIVDSYLESAGSKNYADIPADILGAYGCEDVCGNRELYHYIEERWPRAPAPQGMQSIWDTEILFTSVLFDIEKRGLLTDRVKILKDMYCSVTKLIEQHAEINSRVGFEYTNYWKSNYEVFCNQLGLPVLKWTNEDDPSKESNPSFDKEVMKLYQNHPIIEADSTKKELLDLMCAFRTEKHFKGLFYEAFLYYDDGGHIIHPSYNQVVRTGRMSCRQPNFQQLNYRAKELVVPRPGYAFLSFDASQIEFRLIVHYTNDERALAAYAADARTDFHTWVANLCGIERGPAKTLNFAMAYGAGKKKVTEQLRTNKDIIKEVTKRVAQWIKGGRIIEEQAEGVFARECAQHAANVYHDYHQAFPGIKTVSNTAANNAKQRGFVFNVAGRRRHLTPQAARIAFNAAVQGLALDIIKALMVKLWRDENLRKWDVHQVANVHDEILFEAPIEIAQSEYVQAYILQQLQDSPYPLRVPIRWDGGYSDKNWAIASKDDDALLDVKRLELLDLAA